MKNKMVKAISMALVSALMLSGCGVSNNVQNTPTESSEEIINNNTEINDTESNNIESNDTASVVRYQPEWTKDAIIYEVNVRQYTEEGTFEAFAEHLEELKEMGINTLWFMPIHPISETNRSGGLGSYYSITDYCAVNPEFGTEADFAKLVEKAHEMGFHVMLDWVANHTGWDCAWITDNPEWYTQDGSGNVISPEGMGWPDVADLNYDNQEMRAEMIKSMEYWVETYDIDGYRCDYASGVPLDFWEEARVALEEIKPFYLLAEDDKMLSLLNNAFDFNYGWPLYEVIKNVAQGRKSADKIKLYIPENYPEGTYTLNFLDNHDKNSYDDTIISALGEDAVSAMFAVTYTITGVPLVYTGDEVGLDHQLEFMEKDTIDWETGRSYRQLLTDLAEIRSTNEALYAGNYGGAMNYYSTGNRNMMTFYREKNGNLVKCIYNLSDREQTVDLSSVVDGNETILLWGDCASGYATETTHEITELAGEVVLQPWECIIIRN